MKEEKPPQSKRKAGFYQQYQLEKKATGSGKRVLIDLGDEKWEILKKLAKRIAKIAYYILLFVLSSVGLTALMNVSIREILLKSLFG